MALGVPGLGLKTHGCFAPQIRPICLRMAKSARSQEIQSNKRMKSEQTSSPSPLMPYSRIQVRQAARRFDNVSIALHLQELAVCLDDSPGVVDPIAIAAGLTMQQARFRARSLVAFRKPMPSSVKKQPIIGDLIIRGSSRETWPRCRVFWPISAV